MKGGRVNEGSALLRDRMLRDAVLEVLRGAPGIQPADCSVAELVRRVTVEDGQARIELLSVPCLLGAVRRWVESMPEINQAVITVADDRSSNGGRPCAD